MSKTRIMLPVIVAVLLAALTAHPYPYDNVLTRWALTRSVCDRGSLDIDRYQHLTSDKALLDGHYYPDKAVLLSVAAIPVCLAARLAGMGEPGLPEDLLDDPARRLAERLLVGGSFLLLLLSLLSATGRTEGGLLAVTALGLGSILLPYASLLYAHVPAAAMLFASHLLQTRDRYALSDLTGAMACALEFPVALPFALLLAYRPRAAWTAGSLFRLAAICIAVFLPQILFNWHAFGSPLRMGYSLESSQAFEGMTTGFFGFSLPNLRSLFLLTLSPERGLFFYMPWAAAGLAGLLTGRRLRETLSTDPGPLVVISYILLFGAYYMPSGGWAFGPRHLIPVIPFLAQGLSRFASAGPRRAFCAWLLVLPGILQALVGLLGEVHQPVHPVEQPIPIPQWNIGVRMLLDGHHSAWLGGTIAAALLAASALVIWIPLARGTRPTIRAIIPVLLWAGLLLTSPGGWGSRTAYYRGVLAEHRGEYALASGYYREAARDPSAPAVVLERAERCEALSRGSGT